VALAVEKVELVAVGLRRGGRHEAGEGIELERLRHLLVEGTEIDHQHVIYVHPHVIIPGE
jgi:hypothetical protein